MMRLRCSQNIKFKNNETGASLIWVIILFMIVMIVVPSALFLSRQDTLEAVNQENRMRAYYVALSGVDLGYAALMADVGGSPYINQFVANASKKFENQEMEISGVGKAVVTLDSVTIGAHRWIRITSVGNLNDSAMTATSIMRIRTDNFSFVIRESSSN